MITDEAIAAGLAAWGQYPVGVSPKRQMTNILEAAAPLMFAKVATVQDLDALPRLTVIRDAEGAVFERHTMWHEAGSRDLKYSPAIALPVTVLQLGWGEE